MSKKSQFLKSVTLAIAAVSTISATSALAKDAKMEKCYGVAKAAKNDCASAKPGAHSCAGGATIDGDKNEWIFLPAGICDRLVNGSTKTGK
jgi:uncharacterized membrane protein